MNCEKTTNISEIHQKMKNIAFSSDNYIELFNTTPIYRLLKQRQLLARAIINSSPLYTDNKKLKLGIDCFNDLQNKLIKSLNIFSLQEIETIDVNELIERQITKEQNNAD